MSDSVRVLIVDDDVPTRLGLRVILESEPGFEVAAEAATGLEACALAADLRPDVVLMDIHLPDLDGIEATRRILNGNGAPDGGVRVIVLTTFDRDDYALRSMQAGASGFLLKRTPAEQLVEAVRVVADGEALAVPALTRGLIARSVDPADTGSPAADALPWPLTDREAEVLSLLAHGRSNQQIAQQLYLAIETVRTHVKRTYAKLGVHDRAQAVIAAYEAGLVDRPG